jgi:hypothetical protein
MPCAEEAPPRPIRRDLLAPALILLGLALTALWPGDVSWLMDEPRLIATAWHLNHDGQIAVGGLYGNFGIRYGPLPTQIYQLLLLVTHDPLTLVVLRSVLCAGVSGFGLLWLGRSLGLPGWFAAGVMVSPYVVAYNRVLWDASFAMPVGVLALAAFADFLRTRRNWSLCGCVLASVLAVTIHPQALPLTVSILGWLGWQHRAALWQARRALVITGLVVLLLNGFYFVQFAGQLAARLSGSVQKGYPGGGSHWISALAPLLGGRLLCGADYLEKLARPGAPEWLHTAAAFCATLFYPLAWAGILFAGRTAWQVFQRRKTASADNASADPREAVAIVVFIALGLQALLFGLMRIPAAPQYFFGTFVLHVVVAWLAVNALRPRRIGIFLGALYATGCATLTLEAALSIHEHGYERPLWPTLANSVSVVRQFDRFGVATVFTTVAVYQKSPQALRTLRLLLPPDPGAPLDIRHQPFVTRASGNETKPGEAIVLELPSISLPPRGSQEIEVTPLPEDWVPDRKTWCGTH